MKPTIRDLPTELHQMIISHLDYPSRVVLAQTNQYFRALVPARPPTTSFMMQTYLCEKEVWPMFRQYFACGKCLQLIHYTHFTAGQVTGKYAKLGSRRHIRVCSPCYRTSQFTRYRRSVFGYTGYSVISYPATNPPYPMLYPVFVPV
ncbi:F-box protein [Aspergillus alliaceus]|uniref:F-box protein n=1 Tax=Petromyces alliaceus TaxID=209559 RepID=UPI0012A589CF|nr:uncharacterized protein BDW43DRAFT_283058 [Aspergillus alliaceus]KAB8231204.1 hypothetical protein BDW43DRAFT_283058 [Aspergillus alliaceus]